MKKLRSIFMQFVLVGGGGLIGGALALAVVQMNLANADSHQSNMHDGGSAPKHPLSAQDRRKELDGARERFHARLDAHANEPLDAVWAEAQTAALRRGLTEGRVDFHHADIIEIDCKSMTCVATLGWPNLREATPAISSVVEAELPGTPCATGTTVDAPADPDRAIHVRFLFDCSEARGKGAKR